MSSAQTLSSRGAPQPASSLSAVEPAAERSVASQHAASSGIGDSAHVDQLMEDIRALGRIPKDYTRTKDEAERAESGVAKRLRRLRDSLSEAQKEELANLRALELDQLMQDIRALGRIPKEYRRTKDEAKQSESGVALRL